MGFCHITSLIYWCRICFAIIEDFLNFQIAVLTIILLKQPSYLLHLELIMAGKLVCLISDVGSAAKEHS